MAVVIEARFEAGGRGWWSRTSVDPLIEHLLPGVRELKAGERVLFEMPLNGIVIDWTTAPENSRPWSDPVRRCPNCGRLGLYHWTRAQRTFDHKSFLLSKSKLAVRHPIEQCVKGIGTGSRRKAKAHDGRVLRLPARSL